MTTLKKLTRKKLTLLELAEFLATVFQAYRIERKLEHYKINRTSGQKLPRSNTYGYIQGCSRPGEA